MLKYNSRVTLQQIRDKHPCGTGWLKLNRKFLRAYGENPKLDNEVSVAFVWNSNGFDDAAWVVLEVMGNEPLGQAFSKFLQEEAIRRIDLSTLAEFVTRIDQELFMCDPSECGCLAADLNSLFRKPSYETYLDYIAVCEELVPRNHEEFVDCLEFAKLKLATLLTEPIQQSGEVTTGGDKDENNG